MNKYSPEIAVFACNWSSANDEQADCNVYGPVVRTMCSARVEPVFVLKALMAGADGVMVIGCNPGDCHYKRGSYKTFRRMALLKRMLEQFGVAPERLRVEWLPGEDHPGMQAAVESFAEEIAWMGPFPRQLEQVA